MATLDTILNIRVEGTDSMVKLKTSIDSTTAELKKLKAEGKSAGESQDKYNAKIVTAETKLKGLRGELNKGKTDLLKNAKAVGDSSKSYDSLTKANANLTAQARKLSDPLGKNKKEFSALTAKVKTNTVALKQMDAQMGRQQRNVGNYKQAITSVASAVGIAILAFKAFTRAMGSFTEFQFEMAQVGAISGATASELEMLTTTAKKLGATTAFTAGEVASLQKELSKLGFDATEIEGMTEATLDLAYAFGNDIAETGTLVGVVLNSYKMEASEATHVTDVLAKAFQSSALDLQKFNVAFPKVGAISAQLGFSLEGTTAILGKLSDAGLEASTAGTSLKSVFLKLADSNSALSQKLGGNVKSIDDLLPALQNLYEDGTNVEEMLGLTDKRAVTAFATMVSGADDIAILSEKLVEADGTAKSLAETMRDTMQGSLDEAGSAVDGFTIALFEGLEPVITIIVDSIALLFGGLTSLIKVFKHVAIGAGAYGLVMVATSIAQGTFVSSLVASKVGLFVYNTAVKIAKWATIGFNTAIKANPLGILASALAVGASMLLEFGATASDSAEEMDDLADATIDQVKAVDKLGEIRKKNSAQQGKEISELKALTETIKRSSLSIEERERALKDYNKLAGSNISNLQDEKTIIDQLEKSYDNAVDAIKRKIILQSSEEQVTELIRQQIDLTTKRNGIEKVELSILEDANILKDKIAKLDLEREKNGLESLENTIEADKKLRYQASSGNEKLMTDLANDIIDQGTLVTDAYSNIEIPDFDLPDLEVPEFEFPDFENIDNINEGVRLISELADVNEDLANAQMSKMVEDGKVLKLENAITAVYATQSEVLSGLTTVQNKSSFSTGKLKTEYQKLGDAVKVAETELKNQATLGAQRMAKFLADKETEKLTVEEVNARIVEIETETASKVKTATDNLIKSKKELKVVDDAIAKQNAIIAKTLGDNVDAMEVLRKKGQENIDVDKKQLKVLKDLEIAGADLAYQRISLALKIAKAELDLALATAQSSDLSTDAQVANIKRLQGEVVGFQANLDGMKPDGGSGGFLQDALFGTDENGEPFTGEDLLMAIDMTLSQVSDILSAFNGLQQERLDTKLGIIERSQAQEIKQFEQSAEAQVMTTEERDARIEEITASHDAQMLTLKIEQFKKDQNLAIAQALISGGQSIMGILGGQATGNVIADAIIKGILMTASVAMTAIQISTIKAQAPPTAEFGGIMNDSFFAQGGMVNGKSHSQGGEKFAVGGRVVELEGGEAVINKRSTAMFKPMLSNMNVAGGGRKFADGGMVFGTDRESNDTSMIDAILNQLNNQQILMVEADVTRSQRTVKNIESRISF